MPTTITIESTLDYRYLRNRTKEQLIDLVLLGVKSYERLEAENARLKKELRPWEMLRKMMAQDALWFDREKVNRINEGVLREILEPVWIEARYNEWRERFPQESE